MVKSLCTIIAIKSRPIRACLDDECVIAVIKCSPVNSKFPENEGEESSLLWCRDLISSTCCRKLADGRNGTSVSDTGFENRNKELVT